MELRSSRSRSRTPFVQLTRLDEHETENMSNTMKQEQIVKRRYTTRHQYQQQQQITVESSEKSVEMSEKNGKGRHKTSDYSSEDDVFEVEYDANSETNGKVKSALQVYKEAGEYWNKFPKTDYTYSLNSKDRVEVAPGVICMPNMSRKSLRRSMEPSSTVLSTSYDTQSSASASSYRNHASYNTRRQNHNLENHRKTLNFDDDSYAEETTTITSVYRRVLTSTYRFFRMIYRSFMSVLLMTYAIVQNSVLWLARSYYQTVSRMFLFDTWLMQKATTTTSSSSMMTSATSSASASRKKYGALIALMLLPLLLFAGWTVWTLINNQQRTQPKIQPPLPVVRTDPKTDSNNNKMADHLNHQNIIIAQLQNDVNSMKTQISKLGSDLLFYREAGAKCCRKIHFLHQLNQRNYHLPTQPQSYENDYVLKMIQEALEKYDADKTGLTDYALESSGGQIISTRCTENYHSRTAVLSVLGIPLWYPSNTPRTIITPGAVPGDCWAFQNFPGFVVIQLSARVRINGFSLEHIPARLAAGQKRDSAPRLFTVWGLETENDHSPHDFGKFEYHLEGPAIQFYPVRVEGPMFNLIELRVESNHGNVNYTCLYRFRVHGTT